MSEKQTSKDQKIIAVNGVKVEVCKSECIHPCREFISQNPDLWEENREWAGIDKVPDKVPTKWRALLSALSRPLNRSLCRSRLPCPLYQIYYLVYCYN